MALILFGRWYRCHQCGATKKYTHQEDAICCGGQMVRGHGNHSYEGFLAPEDVTRIELATPRDKKVVNDRWEETWEVWVQKPSTDHGGSHLGFIGKTILGLWEYAAAPGLRPIHGIKQTKQDAAQALVDELGAA